MGSGLIPSIVPATGNVVTRKVFINNTELSNEITVSQLTIHKSFNKIAYAKVVFMDGTVASRDFVLSNDDRFKPGSEIKIQLGFDGNAETIFEGVIVKHGIKIRQVGASLLMIEAKDKAIKLTGARKSAYYTGMKDSDIITQIATGLDTSGVDATTFTHEQMVQFEATNWDFIVTRAEANGMLVLTDDNKLVIKQPATTTPVLTATYGQNIWEFEAEMDARRQVQTVTGHSWDYTQQTAENSDAGTAGFTENGNLPSTDLAAVLGAEVHLTHSGNLTQDQLQQWANAYALRNQIGKAAGRVRIQGNATVKPGTTVTLDGVGDRFNGDVFVTGIMHHFEGSWQTDIQFGWKEEWFYKKENVMEKPAAGLLPGINGLQIGLVVTENETGDGAQHRVKVHIPGITTSEVGIWARVATLDAGAERGVYFRPQQGDEVVLGFLSDDPREPIILGYLHSKDAKKSPLPETEGSLEYGFVTKEGVKLIFDDTNKKMTLSVPSGADKKTIVLNDGGAMELKDENQNSIKMDSTGITIDAGSGMVTVKGSTIKLN
jgi:Rhs element Vgr protein